MSTTGIVVTTSAQHGYENGQAVFISDTSAAAVGIANDTYYVRVLNNRQFVLYYDSSLTNVVDYDIGQDYTGTAEIFIKNTAPEGISGLYTQPSSFTLDGRGGATAGGGISNLSYTVTSNVQNLSISSALTAAGWDGASVVNAIITINAGIYVWSDTTGTAALTVEALPEGSNIDIINNGYIMGRGGNGQTPTQQPQAGGPAVDIDYSVSITNNSFIAGGGGGGGGGGTAGSQGGGGGGAGGGTGGVVAQLASGTVPAGGSGGNIGLSGGAGTQSRYGPVISPVGSTFIKIGSGGGGGRILPGTAGAAGLNVAGTTDLSGGGGGAGGGGGGRYQDINGVVSSALGGAGGSAGNTGGNANPAGVGGGGGGWGASGGFGNIAGALGGKAVNLNGNTVTWVATGTRYGAIS